MGTGYTRADVSNNIADGNIINSSDLDNEYDAIEAAFNSSTGHTHDGTSAEGGPITVVGPVQDLVVSATEVKPKTTNTLDLGTSALLYKDAYLQGNMYFRDTALKIVSSADGQLDIDADVEVEITAPTLDIDASTAVTIDTATLTITGSANVVGDLDVDNININGNTIISTDTNGNIALTPNGTGEVDISKVDIDSGAIDGTVIGASSAAAITGTTITGTSFVSSGDMTFGDDDRAIFGAGSDLQIYHDSLNSWVRDTGTGFLTLDTNGTSIRLVSDGSPTGGMMGEFTKDGSVDLYYDNSKKLATTATGVDITGTLTADGLTVDGVSTLTSNSSADGILLNGRSSDNISQFTFRSNDGTVNYSQLQSRSTEMFVKTLANIPMSFHTNNTEAMRIDSSGNVGIGTTSPSALLTVEDTDAEINVVGTRGTGATHRIFTGGANSQNFNIFSGGDFYLNADNQYFRDTSSNTRMTITSAGNVGIGTTSPSGKLQVETSGTAANLYVTSDISTSALASRISLGNSTSNARFTFGLLGGGGEVAYLGSEGSFPLYFQTAGTERMRIDSSGNVGIGTASPSSTLSVKTSAGTFNVEPLGAGAVQLASPTSLGFNIGSGYNYEFDVNGSEAMRIDSSGNLLVGKTSASVTTVGAELREDGAIIGVRDADLVALLNRTSSDGEIISLRKDNTTVGSIGASGGRPYFSNGTESIRLAGGSFEPANGTGAASDNTYDLGVSAARWKDLYLSGGVYLGGTGSANKLDDYEEGTWTPTAADAISGGNTTTTGTGHYTKIGRNCTVWFQLLNINTTGMTSGNTFHIQGLPFTVGVFADEGTGTPGFSNISFSGYVTVEPTGGFQSFRFAESTSGSSPTLIIVSDLTSGTASISGAFTYLV